MRLIAFDGDDSNNDYNLCEFCGRSLRIHMCSDDSDLYCPINEDGACYQ